MVEPSHAWAQHKRVFAYCITDSKQLNRFAAEPEDRVRELQTVSWLLCRHRYNLHFDDPIHDWTWHQCFNSNPRFTDSCTIKMNIGGQSTCNHPTSGHSGVTTSFAWERRSIVRPERSRPFLSALRGLKRGQPGRKIQSSIPLPPKYGADFYIDRRYA